MVENALDTLKTAFPNPEHLSPMEEYEADGRAMDSRKYRSQLRMRQQINLFALIFCSLASYGVSASHSTRRLMFPSKLAPSLNIPDLHPKVTYCFSEGSAVS